jgi:ABC-type glycerol-3-phosphate transport system substrate-binding protein
VDGSGAVWDAAAVIHRYRSADDGRRRGPATAALVLCSVLLVAACTSPTRSTGVDVVRVLLADDRASAAAVTAAVVDFEQDHPGVRVVLDGAPFSHIPDLVRAASDTGRPYDLVQWHAFALGAQGAAQPVGGLWEQFGVSPDEWLPGAVEDVTWNGEIYGIPLDTNALVLLVNREIADAADVDTGDLATWEGFRAAAERMTEGEVSGYAVGASNWHSFGWAGPSAAPSRSTARPPSMIPRT